MQPLRKPSHEVTPESLAPLYSNVQKLSNLSGRGCKIEEGPNGVSVVVLPPPEPRRGRLLSSLYGCGFANAVELVLGVNGSQSQGLPFVVTDPLSKVSEITMLPGEMDDNGVWFLPVGTCFDCHYRSDSQAWEFDTPGACCIEESIEESEESEEESSEEESSEESEESEGSEESESSEESSESSEESSEESVPCYPIPNWLQNVPIIDGTPEWVVGADMNDCFGRFTTESCGSGSGSGAGGIDGGTP